METDNSVTTAPVGTSETISTNSSTNNTSNIEIAQAKQEVTPEKNEASLVADIPKDKIEEFNRFLSANGGYEKAFGKMKQTISNPQPEAKVETPKPQEAQEPAPAVQPQAAQPTTPKGNLSLQDMTTQMFFQSLANKPEYASIADDIRNGNIMKEFRAMGVSPIAADGSINQAQLEYNLGILAKSKPAAPPVTPELNDNTANFTKAEDGKVNDMETAMKIMREKGNPDRGAAIDAMLKAAGVSIREKPQK